MRRDFSACGNMWNSVSPFHPHYMSTVLIRFTWNSGLRFGTIWRAAALLRHVVLWQKGHEGYGCVRVVGRTPKFQKRICPSHAMWLTIYSAEHGPRDIGELHALRRYVVIPELMRFATRDNDADDIHLHWRIQRTSCAYYSVYINSTDFDRIMRLQIGQWVEKNKRSIPLFRCCGRRLFLSLYLLDSEHTLLEFLRPLKTHLFCWGQQRLQWLLFLERFINVDHTYLLICLLYCEIFCLYPPIYTTVMTNSSLFLHNCCSVFIGHHTHVSWSIMLYLSHWKFRFWNSK